MTAQDGNMALNEISGRSNFPLARIGKNLLDSGLQMRFANESFLNQTKYVKIGEHEQGRQN
jgi:hypothetical protein